MKKPGIKFADQPSIFHALTLITVQRQNAEENPPEEIEDALDQCHCTLVNLARNAEENDPAAELLQNLAELGARIGRIAHAIVLGQMEDAEIFRILEEAGVGAAMAVRNRESARSAREKAARDFAGHRGGDTGISATDGEEEKRP